MGNKIKILSILFFVLIINILKAQNFTLERGIPFIKNFSEVEYSAHEQNFAIVQDSLGVMYIANFEAILIYDGSNWQKVPTRSGMRVLSLDVAEDGRIYVGGLFDFGYIERSKYGVYSFVSLADTTKSADYTGEIFSVKHIGKKVFFVSEKKMFVYSDSSLKVVDFQNKAMGAYVANNLLFVFFKRDFLDENTQENGLTIFENGKFRKLKDNSSAQIVDVKSIFYLPEKQKFIVGTSHQGFFAIKNMQIEDFDIEINDFLKKNSNTCGVKLSDDLYAFGTLTNGVLLTNAQGEILQLINEHSGLCDNTINDIFKDKEGNLWAATNNGLALIEIYNAVSIIPNKISGISGKINKIVAFNNQIYIATEAGFFRANNNNFYSVGDLSIACWDAVIVGKKVYIATTFGLYYMQNNEIFSTQLKDFAYSLTVFNDLLFVGQNTKITILKISPKGFSIVDTIVGFSGSISKMIVVQNKLYAEVPPGKIYEVDIKSFTIKEISSGQKFISLHLNKINDKIFFSSEKGMFTVAANADTIVPFFFSKNIPERSKLWLYDLFYIVDNQYIITDGSRKNLRFLSISDTLLSLQAKDFQPVSNFSARCFFYFNKNKKIWVGGNTGIIVYDLSRNYEHLPKRKVFFTEIRTINTGKILDLCSCSEPNKTILKIKFADNSLLFRYSAPYYPARSQVEYRYFLEGFDKDTSAWSTLNYRELTNLPPGNYKFYVQAKDQFGNIIEGESFEFKILVPLARRWWAIAIYFLIAGILIKLIIDWRLRIAEKEKEHLEEIIKERTEEIERSKAEIEAQRDIEYAQRKEIMDSIYYARRIQQAVLPAGDIFKEVFDEKYFIFFRPYNVVSGDFFWIKKIKNFVAVVAADCTGHGVPGAFMSMLGTSFLNEIVTRRSLDSAAEILERLRKKVKTSLHQEGKQDEQKDGMDISFYLLDTESLELQFAGAYNPLYVVRNNSLIDSDLYELAENNKKIKIFTDEASAADFTLIELKADRQPIGIYLREKKFTNVNFQLKPGDTLYNFSDGYQDQFGGDTGEKFNAKRFKKLFLSIQEMDMNEQLKIIEQNFLKWKGDTPQIDDVLVLGVKI